MELWYTEEHNENVRFSLRVNKSLYSNQSDFQKVDILETIEFGRLMTLDGLVMVTDKDEFVYHDMIVHPAMAANPDIKRVLVIGGGDGGTVRELARYPGIEHIDMVEIDKMVVDTALDFFPAISCALGDPRVHLFYEDGVKWVEDKTACYDLILIDSTDPVGPGEGLFTTEFYTNCYRALTENGICVNQNETPVYEEFFKVGISSNLKLKKLFPIVEVYQASIPTYPGGYWLFNFASKNVHPLKDLNAARWNALNLKTRYYNTDLHVGTFALPNYVKEKFENATL